MIGNNTVMDYRIDIRRETSSLDPNTIIETWGDSSPPLNRKVHQLSLANKQIGNRLSKKDMSRSWGAGGMPFSILYMNPYSPRGNYASKEILNKKENDNTLSHISTDTHGTCYVKVLHNNKIWEKLKVQRHL